MTDEEDFAAHSQLKWTREGDAWILLYRRRRMGRVVPDPEWPGTWRSIKGSGLSDMANLSWCRTITSIPSKREPLLWIVRNCRIHCRMSNRDTRLCRDHPPNQLAEQLVHSEVRRRTGAPKALRCVARSSSSTLSVWS
jgi:hypothetical protein